MHYAQAECCARSGGGQKPAGRWLRRITAQGRAVGTQQAVTSLVKRSRLDVKPKLARARGQLAAALALELRGSAQTLCDITIVDQGRAAIAVLCPAGGAVEQRREVSSSRVAVSTEELIVIIGLLSSVCRACGVRL